MWTYYPELLSRPVPRYTSYPTAAEFSDQVGAVEMKAGLRAIAEDEALSVYVHIPYCKQICWYCGCNTGAANKSHRLSAYLAALETEIARAADHLGGRGRVRRIAFGGGSPNAIAPVEFVRLVDRLVTMLPSESPEISVELDPRIFNDEWAGTLALCGVDRVSLGVQSFAPHVQQAIGRIQPLEDIRACVESLRDHGIKGINFDLMYGLPGQSLACLEDTLEAAIALRPDRVALFGYAHLPTMIPRQRRIETAALPDAATRFSMAARGNEMFVAAGYDSIGFDHFALPHDSMAKSAKEGTLRRNFQGFTDDQADVLIGFGASSISLFPDRMIQNEKNPGRYRMRLSAGTLPAAKGVMCSTEDQDRGRIIENILCRGESGAMPPTLFSAAQESLADLTEAGLIRWSSNGLMLEPHAIPYARTVAVAFDRYREPDSTRFSSAV